MSHEMKDEIIGDVTEILSENYQKISDRDWRRISARELAMQGWPKNPAKEEQLDNYGALLGIKRKKWFWIFKERDVFYRKRLLKILTKEIERK